jgi:hypothetical protein
MIRNRNNVWLLRPGVAGLGTLPEQLDDTETRSAAEQFADHWQPIDERWQLENSTLRGGDGAHELLGAIRLVAANELVMIFEGGFVAVMPNGSRDFTVAKLDFAVTWLTSTEPEPDHSGARTNNQTQGHSYKPEIYFSHNWHDIGHRFATEAEAEVFVANLRSTWIPQGFVKRDRVTPVREPPNALLDWKAKQAEQLSETSDNNDGRAA